MAGMEERTGKSRDAFNNGSLVSAGREYSPDSIIRSMVAEARRIKPELFGAKPESRSHFSLSGATERRFTLEESKELIFAALDGFDKNLGKKAQEILQTANYNGGEADKQAEAQFRNMAYDDSIPDTPNPFLNKDHKLELNDGSRWSLKPVPPGQCRLQRVFPAGSEQNEYGPANPNPYAVIEYQLDGTIDGVIYMAHELGHAIADDYGHEAGMTYRDNSAHLLEMQAYLSQHIVYDYLKNHSDPTIADAAKRHFAATMTYNLQDLPDRQAMDDRPMSILTTLGLYNHIKAQDSDAKKDASETLLGRNGPKNINEVLAVAGVENKALARSAIQSSIAAGSALSSPTAQKPVGISARPA